jgi:hypothetical protein
MRAWHIIWLERTKNEGAKGQAAAPNPFHAAGAEGRAVSPYAVDAVKESCKSSENREKTLWTRSAF